MTSRSSPPNSDSDTDSDYSVIIDVPPKVLKKARKQAQPQKKKITPPKNQKTPPKAEPIPTEKKSSPLAKKRSLSPASPLIIKKSKPSLPDPSDPPVPKKRITPVAVPSPRSDLKPSSGLLSNLLDAYFLEQRERGASHPWQQLMHKAWGHVRRSQKKKE